MGREDCVFLKKWMLSEPVPIAAGSVLINNFEASLLLMETSTSSGRIAAPDRTASVVATCRSCPSTTSGIAKDGPCTETWRLRA